MGEPAYSALNLLSARLWERRHGTSPHAGNLSRQSKPPSAHCHKQAPEGGSRVGIWNVGYPTVRASKLYSAASSPETIFEVIELSTGIPGPNVVDTEIFLM